MADRTPGQAAYEAYWLAMGYGKPELAQGWPAITPQARAAWEAAAKAAREEAGHG